MAQLGRAMMGERTVTARYMLPGATALALVLAGIPAGAFAEPYDLKRLEAVAPGFAAGPAGRRSLAAGMSLRLPLGSVQRAFWRESEVSLGFDLRTSSDSTVATRPALAESRPLWRVSMTFEGPQTLALNGVRFTDMRRLYADAEEDGGINWWWVGGGVLATGIVAGLTAVAAGKQTGRTLADIFNQPPPAGG